MCAARRFPPQHPPADGRFSNAVQDSSPTLQQAPSDQPVANSEAIPAIAALPPDAVQTEDCVGTDSSPACACEVR
jgi:hypothetical protein